MEPFCQMFPVAQSIFLGPNSIHVLHHPSSSDNGPDNCGPKPTRDGLDWPPIKRDGGRKFAFNFIITFVSRTHSLHFLMDSKATDRPD